MGAPHLAAVVNPDTQALNGPPNEPYFPAAAAEPPVDLITYPPHYTVGGIDTYDFIRVKKLSYTCGQIIKYIVRAGHKGSQIDDLRKAQWYLKRELERLADE